MQEFQDDEIESLKIRMDSLTKDMNGAAMRITRNEQRQKNTSKNLKAIQKDITMIKQAIKESKNEKRTIE